MWIAIFLKQLQIRKNRKELNLSGEFAS